MKVILLQKVPKIGDIDDIVEVTDGYARNFLFPKHLAVQASPKNLNDVKAQKLKKTKETETDLKEQQVLAERLDGLTIDIKEKASDKGLLYAAIGPVRILSELKKKGFKIEKSQVEMVPIKSAGEFDISIHLRHGLEATINVSVSV